MGTTTVAYGMTANIYRASENYIPMDDGWRRLRDGRMPEQTTVHFEVPDSLLVALTKEAVAEALFVATNAPPEAIPAYGQLAIWFANELETMEAVTALSVGDTVTVWGQASVGCQKHGWKEIA